MIKDKKIYRFLRTHETGICKSTDGTVYAWVHIGFSEVEDFAEIANIEDYECFVKAEIQTDSICINLADMSISGELLKLYKTCFDKDEWKQAFNEVAHNENMEI